MKKDKLKSIEEIELLALKGKNVNRHFSEGKMMPPLKDQIQRVNVDFGYKTLFELDKIAKELNVSRQAVIKLFVQRELDHHILASQSKYK